MNSKQIIPIGDFELIVPSDKMYDIATLKIDLRPAIECLINASRPTEEPTKESGHIFSHAHHFRSYYNSMKCSDCGKLRPKFRKRSKKVKSHSGKGE